MKSVYHKGSQIKMKGKLTLLLGCGCCELIDFRRGELKKQHLKEIKFYKKEGWDD